jgi:hypothetical protein
MQGQTRIGDNKKLGITINYWVIPKPKPATYRKLFKPAATSNDYDAGAKYLYLYQARNDSGLKESLESVSIRWKAPMDVITSWGHLPNTELELKTEAKTPYLRVSDAYAGNGIRLVSDDKTAALEIPDAVENNASYLLVNWDDGVKSNSNSSTFGFTSNYPPTLTEAATQRNDLLGTVPVPYAPREAPPPVYNSSISPSPLTYGTSPMAPLQQTPTIPVPSNLGSGMGGLGGGLGNSNPGILAYGSQGIGRIAKEKNRETINTRIEVDCEPCCEQHITPEPASWIYAAFCVLYLALVVRTNFRLRAEK